MLALLLVGLLAAPANAITVTVDSVALKERREVWINVPPACRQDVRCDVLYVLDADALFPLASAYGSVMTAMGRMAPVIVIGIPSRSQDDRMRNFTAGATTDERTRFPLAGGASRFADFLQNEVPAAVASQLPATGRRLIAGHSLAGLFAVQQLSADRGWDGAIAISPTLAWNQDGAMLEMRKWIDGKPSTKQLYVSMADGDTEVYQRAFDRFQQVIGATPAASLRSTLERRTGEDHVTTMAPALQRAMLAFFGK